MELNGYSSEALVLARKNYGEADRILVLFTKHFGQVRVIAKGVRKPKSRKRGHLEIFSRLRFSASRGKGLDIITEAELLDSYDNIRKDLKKVAVAYYLCEVLGKLTREGEKNDSIFTDAVSFLEDLKTSMNLRSLRKKFVINILINLGFWSDSRIMDDPDKLLEEVTERRVNSIRVGKALLM